MLVSAAGLVALFVAAGGFFYGIKATSDTTDRIQRESVIRAYDGCKSGNESKVSIIQAFDILLSAAQANPNPNQTAAEKARSDATIAQFKKDLARGLATRDCGRRPE